MKKTILISLFSLIFSIPAFSNSYGDIFKEINNKCNVELFFGCVNYQKIQGESWAFQTIGIGMTIKGIYGDFGFWPRSYGDDVRVDEWDDEYMWMFHVGYQLPVFCKNVRITPIVGYYSHETGITDGYDYYINNNGIHNEFHCTDKFSGFDYGAKLTINIKHFNISGTLTKNVWYAGIGYEI